MELGGTGVKYIICGAELSRLFKYGITRSLPDPTASSPLYPRRHCADEWRYPLLLTVFRRFSNKYCERWERERLQTRIYE
jgi:hypothetical protein